MQKQPPPRFCYKIPPSRYSQPYAAVELYSSILKKKTTWKTALITGANKGIGLEAARQLAQQGYYVYLGYHLYWLPCKLVERQALPGFYAKTY